MLKEKAEIIEILWTGGWDSTFRLLQAVVVERKTMQPYYLLERERKSSDIEMKTMESIKEKLLSADPNTRGRILPTRFFDVHDIKQCKKITESYRSIARRIHLGTQFDWLARFCFHQQIDKIELCIESGGTNEINRAIVANFNPDAPELDEKRSDVDFYNVFRFYRFPLIDISKLEMKKIAQKNGFLDLMNMTWFCHSPVKGSSCGRCNPCIAVIRDGLGSRISFSGHLRYYRRRNIEKIKGVVEKYPKIYNLLRNMYHKRS